MNARRQEPSGSAKKTRAELEARLQRVVDLAYIWSIFSSKSACEAYGDCFWPIGHGGPHTSISGRVLTEEGGSP